MRASSSFETATGRVTLVRAATVFTALTLFGCDKLVESLTASEINEDITGPTTWTAGNTYHVTRSITVSGTLTLQPGVTVNFDQGVYLTVTGALVADGGSPTTPVVFTSSALSPSPGDWGGIVVRGAGSRFQYCSFLYAGADDRPALRIEGDVAASVTHCTFAFHRPPTDRIDTAAALDAAEAGAGTVIADDLFFANRVPLLVGPTFSPGVNTFSNVVAAPSDPQPNQYNAVFVAGCGRVASNITWPTQTVPYVIGDPVTACNYLTIENGGHLEIGTAASPAVVKLFPSGSIDVAGTMIPHATFTSIKDDRLSDTNGDGTATTPAGGDWSGILVRKNGSPFDQVAIYYAGGDEHSALRFEGDVAATVTNSIFAHHRPETHTVRAAPALDVSEAAGTSVITGNTFYDDTVPLAINTTYSFDDSNTFSGSDGTTTALHNEFQGVVVRGCGQIARSITWSTVKVPLIIGDPDTACNYLTVNSGAQLTLADGVVLKFFGGGSIGVAGTMIANAATQITFTSFQDDAMGGDTNADGATTAGAPGQWSGLRVQSSGSTFNRVHFRFAGGGATGDDEPALRVQGDKAIVVTNSVFAHVQGATDSIRAWAALDLREAAPTGTVVTGNRFYDCTIPLAINALLSLDDSNSFDSGVPAMLLPSRYPGIVVEGCGQVPSQTRWQETEVPFVLGDPETACNYMTVNNGGHLTLGPHVVMKFFLGGSVTVAAGGTFTIDPSAYLTCFGDDHLTDTNADADATRPASGDWRGIKYLHQSADPTCDDSSYMHYHEPVNGDGTCTW